MKKILVCLLMSQLFVNYSLAKSLKGVLTFLPWNDDWNSYMYPDDEAIEKDLDAIEEAGLEIIRLDFLWDRIEPEKGIFDFSKWDHLLKLIQKKNLKILGVLGYSSLWANEQGKWNYPPAKVEDFANFCFQVVNRYKDQVKYWEVWNEPNISFYFISKDWAKDYVKLLKASYKKIKEADPDSFVLNGGLGQDTVSSLAELYQQGAKEYFDIANIHPFFNPVELSKRPYSRVIDMDALQCIEVMNKFGDTDKNVWITEIGCPGIDGKRLEWHKDVKKGWFMGESPSEQRQADFLEDIFKNTRKIERIGALFWAFLRDTRHFKDDTDYFGILSWEGNKKKSYFAL